MQNISKPYFSKIKQTQIHQCILGCSHYCTAGTFSKHESIFA